MRFQERENTAEIDNLVQRANHLQQTRDDARAAAAEATRAKLMAEVSKARLEHIHHHAFCKYTSASSNLRVCPKVASSLVMHVTDVQRNLEPDPLASSVIFAQGAAT